MMPFRAIRVGSPRVTIVANRRRYKNSTHRSVPITLVNEQGDEDDDRDRHPQEQQQDGTAHGRYLS
jgi:hypothetical protein